MKSLQNTSHWYHFYKNKISVIVSESISMILKLLQNTFLATKLKSILTHWKVNRNKRYFNILISFSENKVNWYCHRWLFIINLIFQFQLSWKTIFQNFWFSPKWLSLPSCVMLPVMLNSYYLLLFTIEHDGMTGMTGKLETFVKTWKNEKSTTSSFHFTPFWKLFENDVSCRHASWSCSNTFEIIIGDTWNHNRKIIICGKK